MTPDGIVASTTFRKKYENSTLNPIPKHEKKDETGSEVFVFIEFIEYVEITLETASKRLFK